MLVSDQQIRFFVWPKTNNGRYPPASLAYMATDEYSVHVAEVYVWSRDTPVTLSCVYNSIRELLAAGFEEVADAATMMQRIDSADLQRRHSCLKGPEDIPPAGSGWSHIPPNAKAVQ